MKLIDLLDILVESQEIVVTKPLETSIADTRGRVSFFKFNLLENHQRDIHVAYISKIDGLLHILISSN